MFIPFVMGINPISLSPTVDRYIRDWSGVTGMQGMQLVLA